MDGLRLGSSISTFHKLKLLEMVWFGLVLGKEWTLGGCCSTGVKPGSSVETVVAGKPLAMWTGKSSGTPF